MNRWGAPLLAAVAGLALGFLASRGDDAEQERAARQRAEQQAQQADSAARAARQARDAVLDSLARLDSIYADSVAAARERERAAVERAREVTARLGSELSDSQNADLQTLTDYYEVALDEADEALRQTERRLALARAEADANLDLAMSERERGDRWKSAYDAATAEIKALREPDITILGVKLNVDCGPKLGPAVGINREGKVNTSLARLECEVGPS